MSDNEIGGESSLANLDMRQLGAGQASGQLDRGRHHSTGQSTATKSHRSTRELLTSQNYLNLFKHAPTGYVSLNPAGQIEDINLVACEILQVDPAEVAGLKMAEFLPKSSRDIFENHLAKVWETESEITDELKIISKNHQNLNVRITSKRWRPGKAGADLCLMALIDASKSESLENQLREQREFSDSLLQTAQSIVLVLDTVGNVVKVNRFFEELSGYTQDEVAGKNWMENFIPKTEEKRIKDVFDDAMGGTKTVGNINPIILKDGSEKYIEWYDTQLKDNDGNLTGLLSLGQDITDRVKAEEEIRESQLRLQLMMNALPILIAHLDVNCQYIFANQAHDKWFPEANKAYAGKHIENVVGRPVYEKLRHYLETALNGQQVTGELTVSIQGKEYMFVTNIIALHDQAGMLEGIFLVMDDITQFRVADANTMQYLVQLAHESRINLVGQMMSEIAHEINQPLAAITNYTGAGLRLQQSGKLQPDALIEILENVLGQVTRITEIIAHLRSFTQKREVQFVKTNINELVNHVLKLFSAEKHLKNVDMISKLNGGDVCIAADKVLIEQVLVNLIRNSIEAMQNSNEYKPSVTVSTIRSKKKITVSVSDNGPGLSLDMISQIFKPFFSTKSDSMGLGLSICQSIVELHQGKLWVEQNKGAGVTFNLQLPVCQED